MIRGVILTCGGGLEALREPLDVPAQEVEGVEAVRVGAGEVEAGGLQGLHIQLQGPTKLGKLLYGGKSEVGGWGKGWEGGREGGRKREGGRREGKESHFLSAAELYTQN